MRMPWIACLLLLPLMATAAPRCNREQVAVAPSAGGRILFDRGNELWIMDGDGAHQQRVFGYSPWAALSGDAMHIAHWSVDDKKLRVLSLADGCDHDIDTLTPPIADIGWSNDGRTLAYVGRSARGSGLHVLPFPVGAAVPKVFPGFVQVSLSADGRYAVTSDLASVLRVDLLTGARDRIYTVDPKKEGVWGASFARHGDALAVLMIGGYGSTSASDDDEPDCGGGTTALRIVQPSGAALDVPFPPGFTSVLNGEFSFAPDGKSVAVAFGEESCDYPGDLAAVYLFDLSTRKLMRLSPDKRLAGRPKFSPDGKAVIYTDFEGTGTTAIYRVDLPAGRPRRLTTPREMDSDMVLDWR